MPRYNEKDIVEPSIDAIKQIVEQKQFKVFRYKNDDTDSLMVIDMQTANLLAQAYDRCSASNREKIERMVIASPASFTRVVKALWTLV